MKLAARYQMRAAEFWQTTPREFWLFIAGARQAERNVAALEHKVAWLNAMWQRAERLPSLRSVMEPFTDKPTAPTRALTPAESKQRVRRAFAAWGFETKGSA